MSVPKNVTNPTDQYRNLLIYYSDRPVSDAFNEFIMIRKSRYHILEKLYQCATARRLAATFFRKRFTGEHPAVLNFIEKENNSPLVALNAHEPYQFAHLRPLYEELRRDPELTVILIGSNPRKIARPVYRAFMRQNNLKLNHTLFSYIWLQTLRPAIFLEPAISSYHHLCGTNTIRILFAHGLSSLGFSKNHAHIRQAAGFDYIIATGPYQEKTLKLAAQQYGTALPRILRGGFIRGDMLVRRSATHDRVMFLKRCGLADRHTLLFAPTWGEFSATVQWIDQIVDLSTELDCNLLIKLHPLMLNGQTKWETAGVDWPGKLERFGQQANIHICDHYSLEDYMLASDTMITDVSSVGMEYMFLRKPVLFLPAPRFFKIFGRDKPVFWVRDGLEVKNVTELREKIKRQQHAISDSTAYDLDKISFNRGRTTASIASLIKNLARQDQSRAAVPRQTA